MAGAEVSQHTLAAHLGHNVTLPCVGSDQVVFQGGHASQLITDGTHFIIQEAAEEDQGMMQPRRLVFTPVYLGTYYCYSNNSVVAKVDLILTENVPLLESNSAQPNDEDNSDSNYLRWEQLKTFKFTVLTRRHISYLECWESPLPYPFSCWSH